jgi:PPOX class probable F420-dependent enzyme
MLAGRERRFVERCRLGRLATADRQGRPHVVPVCFALTEDSLYITIDAKPKGDPRHLKRLRNIAENPSVALVVDHWDEDWRRLGWVMLRGEAEILAAGDEHDRAQALLRERYLQYRAMELAALPVIAIRIARVSRWGELDAAYTAGSRASRGEGP